MLILSTLLHAVAVVDVFDVINVDDVYFLDHVSTIDLNACDCLLLLLAIVCCLYLLLVLIASSYYCLGVP